MRTAAEYEAELKWHRHASTARALTWLAVAVNAVLLLLDARAALGIPAEFWRINPRWSAVLAVTNVVGLAVCAAAIRSSRRTWAAHQARCPLNDPEDPTWSP